MGLLPDVVSVKVALQESSLASKHRQNESLDNLTPADVYFGRRQTILLERKRIKRVTIQNRRLQYQLNAA
jgi:hypothetical protein